jgi:hypothetical protein
MASLFRAVSFPPEIFNAGAPSFSRLSDLEHPAGLHASRNLPPPSLRPRKNPFREGTARIKFVLWFFKIKTTA